MLFKNKTVLIIGGSSGMGLELAKAIHLQGANTIIVSRSKNNLEKTKTNFERPEERLQLIEADITNKEGRDKIFNNIGKLDYLVVTAADLVYKPFVEMTEQDLMVGIKSKIIAPYFLSQEAFKKIENKGSITFVSGIAAYRPLLGGSVATIVNGALESMVRALTIELSPIRVNVVSPGWIDTPIWEKIMSSGKKKSLFEEMEQKIPVKRIGKSQDIAQAIISIMTNEFINGTLLEVDGGQRLV